MITKIDQELYIELLQAEVKRLRQSNQSAELRLKVREFERQRDLEKVSKAPHPFPSSGQPSQRQGAVVAGMLGVTPSQAAEAMAEQEFKAPKNLTSSGDQDVD